MTESLSKFRMELLSSLHPLEKARFRYLKHSHQHPHLHKDCKFCMKIREKKDVLLENDHLVVMFGRPHHKGHLVVMPKAHEEDLLKLHQKTLDSFMNDTIHVMRALGKAIKPDMFNMEYLNNWDHHIHWNIYPRFKEDPDWGNPPKIPLKDAKFKPKPLSANELAIFSRELKRIKKELW